VVGAAPVSPINRAALSSVSAHSAAGSEAQVMPAPVPKCSVPDAVGR
jgi:hypothetical protein